MTTDDQAKDQKLEYVIAYMNKYLHSDLLTFEFRSGKIEIHSLKTS